ncbi:HNH endonuclease signature motif containing protein, partial [Georgenia subflava]
LRPGARIRPHLSVHVPFETLQRLIAASAPTRRHPGCPLPTHPGAAFGAPRGEDDDSTGHGAVADDAHDPTGAGDLLDATALALGTGTPTDQEPGTCGCGQPLPEAVIGADLDPAAMTEVEPATFDDGTPLAPSLLARIACTSEVHRVVFGPASEVLDTGREKRLFTTAQTRAIIARDRTCRYPGCDAPPGEGEIHHAIWWWSQHGTTDLKHGILLCWHHHDFVHKRRITIENRGTHWHFTRRDGTTIEPTPHAT